MKKKHYCCLNGKIIEAEKAGLPLDDLGIIRGYGLFDSLMLYKGKPFLLKEHYERLKRGAKELGLKVPFSLKEMDSTIRTLSKKNEMKHAAVRTVITGGVNSSKGFDKQNFFILFEKTPQISESIYKQGGKLITHNHQRVIPQAKTTNYITYIRMQKEQKKQKAVEILYTSEGKVLECATSNFFIIKGNELITPKDNILIGTTRNLIIKLAKDHYKVIERDVSIKELKSADECFLTASFKKVCPIVQIDSHKIGKGKVGEETKLLMDLYEKELEKKTAA